MQERQVSTEEHAFNRATRNMSTEQIAEVKSGGFEKGNTLFKYARNCYLAWQAAEKREPS